MAESVRQADGIARRTILVADDEQSMRDLLRMLLETEGYRVLTATNGREAREVFLENCDDIDLIIQDLKMPEVNGTELLEFFKERSPQVPVVIITAFSSWDNAVDAMRLGAYDYIRKPFDTDSIRLVVSRAIERQQLLEESSEETRREIASQAEMIGNHPKIQEVLQMVRRVAPTDSTILIQGESGTGKELVARAVHLRSLRKTQPFISVNCSAFTESLLESELFGHVRGAFTGAVEDKKGFFRASDSGTLFLDEIADMSLTTQVKILRVLEERKVCPVGTTACHPVDVRILAATNKDMETEVKERRFREDLYYRLNVIPIWLPPLRERKDDIPLLTGFFLAKYARQMRKNVTVISEDARESLFRYNWPGNVRELENIIQRHVALCDGTMIRRIAFTARHVSTSGVLPESEGENLIPEEGISLEEHLSSCERQYLREALRMTGGNLTNAAKLLGMSYRSMRYRVKKLKVRETELA
ncbi:MAG: sigma-54 dependent transcriptional regulator [Planctomycetota bacterium]|nr:sigma-54 dependent transcriptional regulator [Planctomycetota bacterium]